MPSTVYSKANNSNASIQNSPYEMPRRSDGQHKSASYQVDELFIRTIAIGLIEVLYGARTPTQLARWVNDKTYRDLERRAALVRQQLSTGGTINRVPFAIATVKMSYLHHNRISSVVIVHFPNRVRAITLDLILLQSGRPRIETLTLI